MKKYIFLNNLQNKQNLSIELGQFMSLQKKKLDKIALQQIWPDN